MFFRTAIVLTLISLGYFATDIYIPSLPAMANSFSASESAAQLTIFSYLISFALTPLFFGPLSDRVGRIKIISFGLIICLFATLLCALAPSIQWLIFGRFVQGIGMGAIVICTRAMITDLYTGIELAKQISYITMLMPIILAFAPTLGGWVQENYDWRPIFYLLFIYMTIILLSLTTLSESLKKKSTRPLKQVWVVYKSTMSNRPFILYSFCMTLPAFALFSYLTASPFLFQELLDLSPAEYGRLAIYIGIVIMVFGFINIKLLNYFSIDSLLYAAGCIYILAGVLLAVFSYLNILSVLSIMIPSVLYCSCIPIGMSNAASKSMSYIKEHYGSANALASTIQLALGALGSLIFSLIPETNTWPLAICYMAVGVLFTILLSLAKKSG